MDGPELSRTYEPSRLVRALLDRFFESLKVEESWLSEVRRVAERGSVVFVLRSLNLIDFLALDYLTRRHDLPRIRFVNDLGLGALNPMGRGLGAVLSPRSTVPPRDQLLHALSHGGSAALFLKRPPGALDAVVGATRGRVTKEGDELVHALFELQRSRATPILLLPLVFVWSKHPDTRVTEPLAFFIGSRTWPSTLRTLGQWLSNAGHAILRLGEPVDLQVFLTESEGQSDASLVRRLTYAVLRRLERERRSITGPVEKAPERVRQEIVRGPRLKAIIDDLSDEKNDRYALQARALKLLEELQATPDRTTIRLLEVVFDRVFQRIYAGVEYDPGDIERLREASRKGTLILLPSHKSHIDYLILSYIFNLEDLPLPVIAAGDNLNFFPAGPILRRGGAFFIRRSFRGDRLYAAVVDSYIRRLIRDGYPIELFLEGGRSRTGKLLPPKFGLLNMIVDAALALDERPSYCVPVSIGYERVIEGESYERELRGGEKTREDAAGLFRSRELLRHRYGRINMQVGQILGLSEMARELGQGAATALAPAKRRALVTRLGNRVMDEINRVTAVSPGALSALVLLSHEERALSHEELLLRASRLLGVARGLGARTSGTLVTAGGELRPESIREALQMFASAGLVEVERPEAAPGDAEASRRAGDRAIYTVVEGKRLVLDTTKNIIVHFFVERALVALSVLSLGDPSAEIEAVRARVRDLSRLFKFEFRFRADAAFDVIFQDTLDSMQADQELVRDGDRLGPGAGREEWSGLDWLVAYAAILKNFLETYRIAARSLSALADRPLPEKELMRRALATGHRMFLDGQIRRREAVSKPILEHAFDAFADQGLIVRQTGKVLLGPGLAGASDIEALEATIVGYLPGRAL